MRLIIDIIAIITEEEEQILFITQRNPLMMMMMLMVLLLFLLFKIGQENECGDDVHLLLLLGKIFATLLLEIDI